MKRFSRSAVLALLLVAAFVPMVGASDQWCEDDPVVVIKTPGGSLVTVYVTNGARGVEHLPAVLSAQINYTATSTDGQSATLVQMSVLIPDDEFDDHFETRSTVSTGPMKTGTILATASGFSGQAMFMTFKLNVP